MRQFICLLVLCTIGSGKAVAQLQCGDLFSKYIIGEPETRTLTYKAMIVTRRNDGVMLQQYGDLDITKYYDIEYNTDDRENLIGMTADGRIYHIVRNGKVKTARLLSGEDHYVDFLVASSGLLMGITAEGRVNIYTAAKWEKSPIGPLVKKNAIIWTATNAAIISGIGIFYPDAFQYTMSLEGFSVPIFAVAPGILMLFSQIFSAANDYGHRNTYTDGFIDTHLHFTTVDQLREDLKNWAAAPLDVSFVHQLPAPVDAAVVPLMPPEAREQIAH